ncbi:MAG: GTPase HflX [Clostridia bacterium]
MIKGNLESVRDTVLAELEALFTPKYALDDFIDISLLNSVCNISQKINKEIAIFIDKASRILQITIGDKFKVSLVGFSKNEFKTIRVFHTHLNGSSDFSILDESALKNLKPKCLCAIGVSPDGKPLEITVAYMLNSEIKSQKYNEPARINSVGILHELDNIKIEATHNAVKTYATKELEKEKAILVGLQSQGKKDFDYEQEIEELIGLSLTAGLEVVDSVVQKRDNQDPVYYVGKGKMKEIKSLVQIYNADVIICNDELKPSKLVNMQDELGIKVIDRTMLILDIFAQRARTSEGKTQVELAQLKYMIPRVNINGSSFGKFGSGVGSRGPGEKKIELNKRNMERQMENLEKQIDKLKDQRDVNRRKRLSERIKTVAIVGYTNSGKSTLMNIITKANIYADDKLFATLDTTTRKIWLDLNKEFLLTDTVGFINNLNHDTVEAFKSTLEEAIYADLLLHVIDVSNPNYKQQYKVVLEVLEKIGAKDIPQILVYNKIDKNQNFEEFWGQGVKISALKNQHIDELKNLISKNLWGDDVPLV